MARLTRYFWFLLAFFMGAAVFYLLLALLLMLIKISAATDLGNAKSVRIYLVSNGVHASLALPQHHDVRSWQEIFSVVNTQDPQRSSWQPYVLIGWGSRAFYTQVPRWRDLTASLALRALFLDQAVLNVQYIDEPVVAESIAEIVLTVKQYGQLVASIDRAITRPLEIVGTHYGLTDSFYVAKGSYSPIYTCNEWIRQQLKAAEVSVPLWAPFSFSLFWHLP